MVDIDQVKILILEDEYPYFQEDTLKAMCQMYDDVNELCYIACNMKAKNDKISIGPITIESNADMWNNMANMFYKKWQNSISSSKSLTGRCMSRADEY